MMRTAILCIGHFTVLDYMAMISNVRTVHVSSWQRRFPVRVPYIGGFATVAYCQYISFIHVRHWICSLTWWSSCPGISWWAQPLHPRESPKRLWTDENRGSFLVLQTACQAIVGNPINISHQWSRSIASSKGQLCPFALVSVFLWSLVLSRRPSLFASCSNTCAMIRWRLSVPSI